MIKHHTITMNKDCLKNVTKMEQIKMAYETKYVAYGCYKDRSRNLNVFLF